MEIWLIILISLCIAALFNLLYPTKKSHHKLPPSPPTLPFIGKLRLLRKSPLQIQAYIRSLNSKLGPIITLHLNSPTIIISDSFIAHQALIQNGAIFASRPSASATARITNSNQHTISSAAYGPTWRLLRRNLTSEILHPSRVKSYSHARKWVLQILLDSLNSKSKSGDPVRLIDHFQHAMFSLLVLMCFGDKLDEQIITQVKDVEHRWLQNLNRSNILNFWPRLTKILFRKRWEEFFQTYQQKYDVLMPLIKERRKWKEERLRKAKQDNEEINDEYVLAYVDTLFDLQLPEEKRRLDEKEIMDLCSELLVGGTDTTSTALQWVMANLVKYPHIQEKLFREIKEVVGDHQATEVKEDDLQKMPYLKAVIFEGLRRHPPGHFLIPHAVTEDVALNGFLIPKNATVNFMVADMGWDSKVWDDPMSFKPERFLNSEENRGEVFDITGSREIKMMPFGVGRRICPGLGLANLHLEYFVANLIWKYEWKAVDGDEVNLEVERELITVAMKNPLQANLIPRFSF